MAGYGGNTGLQQRRGGNTRSLFYRDLGISPSTGRPPSSSGRSGSGESVAALWRDTTGTDPPPPPCFTLDDRFERSATPGEPMTGVEQSSYRSPSTMVDFSSRSPPKTPMSLDAAVAAAVSVVTPSPSVFPSPVVPGSAVTPVAASPLPPPPSSAQSSWWSPREKNSLFDFASPSGATTSATPENAGVVVQHQSGLLTLPTPREIIRPDSLQRSGFSSDHGEDGDEWVTIYGFPAEDTNAVLREFEKCGPIVRHVAGPPNSNWLHIQYESRQDARKALLKNGMQLYGALIIGVKPVDPIQRQALMGRERTPAFTVIPPKVKNAASTPSGSRPYYLQATDAAVKSASTTIASPSKSMLSKIVDLVLGC